MKLAERISRNLRSPLR